jgi:large subunit ribosomal protein L24
MNRLADRDKERHPMLIRKGDLVRVMVGRDREEFHRKAKTARVLSVDPVKQTVTVEQAHLIKRRTRPNPQKNIKGGIIEREAPIHVSNVRLVCPSCAKPTRVGHKVEWISRTVTRADGTEVDLKKRRVVGRVCRHCGASLEK